MSQGIGTQPACAVFHSGQLKNHLAEVVRSKPSRRIYGKTPHTPPFWPFWAYSRTLPQGVELLVQPLVKSLFCPINASPNEFLVRTPLDPPHLKPTFLRFSRRGGGGGWGGGGWGGGSKNDPPLFLGRKS